jgi:hypothetical protein
VIKKTRKILFKNLLIIIYYIVLFVIENPDGYLLKIKRNYYIRALYYDSMYLKMNTTNFYRTIFSYNIFPLNILQYTTLHIRRVNDST